MGEIMLGVILYIVAGYFMLGVAIILDGEFDIKIFLLWPLYICILALRCAGFVAFKFGCAITKWVNGIKARRLRGRKK